MKKKGFTLIELLAVIVVLAIITLIATPIVMNTIKSAKKGAAERSADSYISAVETTVATAKLDGKDIPDGTYQIDGEGNLTGTGLPNGKLEIDMKGNKPTGGTITIKNGQVTTDSKMTVGSYEVTYNEDNKKYEATENDGDLSTICELQEGTSQTVGAKYTCHLDSDRTFYVLETSEDKVSLIMDKNFTDDTVSTYIGWCMDGSEDNTECENIITKEDGRPLKHIQDTFGTNVEVSIPSASQIALTTGKTFDGTLVSGLSTWLYDHFDVTGSIKDVFCYWTSTIDTSNHLSVWNVTQDGNLGVTKINQGACSIRPVITISKSQLG